jgi:uncharacterized membrane protein
MVESEVRRSPRLAYIDVARGIAVLAMVAYHFSWDLSERHLIAADVVGNPIWRAFARSIAGSFLILVGISLVLATRDGIRWRPFLRRLVLVLAGAALVSLGTWWFAPDSYVFFGILHMIAVGSVLALPFLFLPSWLVGVAVVLVGVAPRLLAAPVFDQPFLWWLGLAPVPPPTVDFVPVLPWLAPILFGILVGRLLRDHPPKRLTNWRPAGWLPRFLGLTGRWSLPVYVVHQPLLMGALMLAAPILPANHAAEQAAFHRNCAASCHATGASGPACELFCGCVYDGFVGTPLMTTADPARLAPQDAVRRADIINVCRKRVGELDAQ